MGGVPVRGRFPTLRTSLAAEVSVSAWLMHADGQHDQQGRSFVRGGEGARGHRRPESLPRAQAVV